MNKLSNTLISIYFNIPNFIYFDPPYLYSFRDAGIFISDSKRDIEKKISVGLVFMKGDKFATNLVIFLID